jgi:predicted phosphate transport protein (TIGR00153 family)
VSLIHKEEDYFAMFSVMGAFGRDAALKLCGLLRTYEDVPARVAEIKEVEYAADREVKKIMQRLNGSFITPIDREDILLLTRRLDGICDTANVAAQRLVMYNVASITEDALGFAALIDATSEVLTRLMTEMRRVKKSRSIGEMIEEVNRLEREGDELYHRAMRRLFSGSFECLDVIRWNETYQSLEKVIDASEDVANTVQRLVVKYT